MDRVSVVRLLRRGRGLSPPGGRENSIGDGLDDLGGTWAADEAQQFSQAVAVFQEVDEELWR